jgi:predicted metal-dependent hydrolase
VKSFIDYGEERISFVICFLPKPVRRIAIHVMPNGAVHVDAPEGAEISEVLAAVRRRARWIWQHLTEYRARMKHVLSREYISGESHFYLGKRYSLKVIVNQSAQHGVKLLRGRLEVITQSTDREAIRKLLDTWYRQRAAEVFARRVDECASQARWIKRLPSFRLRTMRTQWGSCSPNGELLLNPQLVKAPRHCIDYVIFHELCHLKEHNHSPHYYRLLSGLLPDWEQRKAELDNLAESLLNR